MENGLYRDKSKAILGGVAAGIAEQLKLDINLIRALFILLVLFGRLGISTSFVAYVVLWICLPSLQQAGAGNTDQFSANYKVDPSAGDSNNSSQGGAYSPLGRRGTDSSTILGFILVSLGAIMLADRFITIDWNFMDRFWPLALVAAGLLIVFKARK